MEIVVPDEFKYLYVQNAERPVVKIPDPVLRKVCQPVPKLDKKVNEFIDEMIAALKKANGVGIAAPQMGKALRLIIIAPHALVARDGVPEGPGVEERGEEVEDDGAVGHPSLL